MPVSIGWGRLPGWGCGAASADLEGDLGVRRSDSDPDAHELVPRDLVHFMRHAQLVQHLPEQRRAVDAAVGAAMWSGGW